MIPDHCWLQRGFAVPRGAEHQLAVARRAIWRPPRSAGLRRAAQSVASSALPSAGKGTADPTSDL